MLCILTSKTGAFDAAHWPKSLFLLLSSVFTFFSKIRWRTWKKEKNTLSTFNIELARLLLFITIFLSFNFCLTLLGIGSVTVLLLQSLIESSIILISWFSNRLCNPAWVEVPIFSPQLYQEGFLTIFSPYIRFFHKSTYRSVFEKIEFFQIKKSGALSTFALK